MRFGKICLKKINLALVNQLLISIFASLGYFSVGLVRAWTSPAIPSIQGQNGTQKGFALPQAPLSKEEVSWITSLTPLGALVGGLMSTIFLTYLGRRRTLIFAGLGLLSGFIFKAISFYLQNVITIMIARVILGFVAGLCIPASQIYITECVETRVRGLFGSITAVAMALGILVCYGAGSILPWHFLSFFCAGFPMLLFIFMASAPESPVWLLSKSQESSSLKSLQWLRGNSNVTEEFDSMKLNLKTQKQLEENTTYNGGFLSELLSKSIFMPLTIVLALQLFQQWCGINAIIFNISIIFNAVESDLDRNLSSIIVGIVQFVATLASIFVIDKMGRRVLLILSGLIMSLTTCLIGTYFYLSSIDKATDGLTWIPLVSLMIYMIGYSIGFASIPFLLMGELFPNKFRSIFGGLSSFFNLLNTFLVTKLFSNLESLLGFHGVFWIYSGFSIVSIIFVYLFLPETKGKTIDEIESYFKTGSKKIDN